MRNWRIAFACAAIYNILVGLPMLLDPISAYVEGGMPAPASLVEPRFGGLAILTFGLAYALVALNPERNVDIVRMGVISKFSAFSLIAFAFAAGEAGRTFFALGIGDLIWGVLFLAFLKRRTA